MSSSVGQWRWKSSRKEDQSSGNPCCSKYCSGNEKPWSMPTSVGGPSVSLSTSHSAMPLRVQYFRGLGGGPTSCGAVERPAAYTRRALRLDLGVSAPE